jgi:hypothetical protein
MSLSPRPPGRRFRIERLEQRIAPAIIASELMSQHPAPAQPAASPPPPATASAPPPPTPPAVAVPPPAGPPPTSCACPPAGLTASLNLGAALPTGGWNVCRC